MVSRPRRECRQIQWCLRTEKVEARLWVFCEGEGEAKSAWALDSLEERRKQSKYQEGSYVVGIKEWVTMLMKTV